MRQALQNQKRQTNQMFYNGLGISRPKKSNNSMLYDGLGISRPNDSMLYNDLSFQSITFHHQIDFL